MPPTCDNGFSAFLLCYYLFLYLFSLSIPVATSALITLKKQHLESCWKVFFEKYGSTDSCCCEAVEAVRRRHFFVFMMCKKKKKKRKKKKTFLLLLFKLTVFQMAHLCVKVQRKQEAICRPPRRAGVRSLFTWPTLGSAPTRPRQGVLDDTGLPLTFPVSLFRTGTHTHTGTQNSFPTPLYL